MNLAHRFARSCRLAVERLEARNLLAPTMLHPDLDVRTVAGGLTTPTTIAFLGENDFLVTEKNTGRVQRVFNGKVAYTVLDLNVNFASERGLLSIALHPHFPKNPGVYLYWTASSIGGDSNQLPDTPLLGNRVDRFVWDGVRLRFDQNLLNLRALQPPNPPQEPGQFGNHDGGVIKFGFDGMLYVFIGDVGRRGQTQNNLLGPIPDDQFGGPQPDNAHATGAIFRLQDNGAAPEDNPFFEAGANIQKLYAYGFRNGFGFDFDPFSGNLWLQENADNSYTEINLVDPGLNGGWIQVMGPLERVADFKFIEVNMFGGALQQMRWPPTNIADTPEEAFARLWMVPGAHYSDPEFSWRFEIAPGGLGFVSSRALGREFEGNFFLGAATPNGGMVGGYLFRFQMTADRRELLLPKGVGLEDLVDDNPTTMVLEESAGLLIGRDFGIGTDIKTAPNGNVYVVSLSDGAVYEIFRKAARPADGVSDPAAGVIPALMSSVLPAPVFAAPAVQAVVTREAVAVFDPAAFRPEQARAGQSEQVAESSGAVDAVFVDVFQRPDLWSLESVA